jgi:hypothetical protein
MRQSYNELVAQFRAANGMRKEAAAALTAAGKTPNSASEAPEAAV